MKTTDLSIASVNFDDPEEMARFRREQDALYAARKRAIIEDRKHNGDLNERGEWVFKEPLPGDMLAESLADLLQRRRAGT